MARREIFTIANARQLTLHAWTRSLCYADFNAEET